MKILHGTNEIATLMKTQAEAQRILGHEVTTVEYSVGHIQNGDIRLFVRTPQKGVRSDENRKRIFSQFINEHLLDYDVYHFYFGTSLYMDLSDLDILRKNGKTIIMHLCGADCHNRVPNQSIFDHFRRVYHNHPADMPPMMIRGQHRALSIIDQAVDAFITGTWLIDHAPRLALMPRTNKSWGIPIEIQAWRDRIASVDVTDKDPDKVYILHAPTSWHTKGSDFVIPVLDKLKRDGYPIEIILIQGMLPSEIHRMFAKADIVIEQILAGWYAQFACEMMAVGKPVVSRIDPYLQSQVGLSPPLVNASPHTLYEELVKLIEDIDYRERVGEAEMAYVEEHHDHMKIGQDLLELYDSLHHDRPVIQIPNPDFYTRNETTIQPFWSSPRTDPLIYEEMIEKNRVNNFEMNLQMAQLYLKKGMSHQAIPFLERCVDLKPDYLDGMKQLAIYYLDRFRYTKALYYIGLLLDQSPPVKKSLIQIAEQRVQMERYHDGIRIYEFLHEREPENDSLLLAQAKIYAPIGEYQRAENLLQIILESSPNSMECLKLLVETYKGWGKTEKARRYQEKIESLGT